MKNEAESGERTGEVAAGVVIYARDMARLAMFYARVAGLAEVQCESDFMVLGRGAFELVIVAAPARIAARVTITEPPQRRADTPIKPVFCVCDIEAVRDAVAELGGVLDPIANAWQFGAWRVQDGHDPEGNVFQLREPIR